jgi:fucokinase
MSTDSPLADIYAQICRDHQSSLASSTARQWDYVVITASNAAQAQAFADQIASRKAADRLPPQTHFLCIPDRDGTRVGSGGATLGVLKAIVDLNPAFRSFHDFRILIIHSGGDSKRVPQYSACGKLFSPVPRVGHSNQRDTLFDEFIALAATFPDRLPGGIVVGSGDVLLLFDPCQIAVSEGNAVAMSSKVSVDIGVDHGVFLADESGEIVEFLHKQPEQVLRSKGAVDADGNVDLDIGFVWLSGDVTDALWQTISVNNKFSPEKYDCFVSDSVRLSFYADFLFPLASHSTLEQYFKETPEYKFSDELQECRRELWPLLHRFKMQIRKLEPAIYIHFGTTTELRSLMTDELAKFNCLGWQRSVLSNIPGDCPFTAINSFLSDGALVGEGTYLEDARLGGACRIGRRCVISNADLQGAIDLPDDTVVHALPVQGTKFCLRLFQVGDNPKQGKFFGYQLTDFLDFYRISPSEIFEGADHSLWGAKLYPIVDRREEEATAIGFLLRFVTREASPGEIAEWLGKERNSLSCANADITRILEWQSTLREHFLP